MEALKMGGFPRAEAGEFWRRRLENPLGDGRRRSTTRYHGYCFEA